MAERTPGLDGSALARRAVALGLAVTRNDGSVRAIPVASTPVVLDPRTIAYRRGVATRLVSATAKAARLALGGDARARWLDAMSPVERRLVESTWRGLDTLATARVDFSVDAAGTRALEVNATIPAMQGYSDIAARAYIEARGAALGLDAGRVDALVARNGSNTAALLASLEAAWAAHRPAQPLRSIALLCRRGDAQITELAWLRDRFAEAGRDAAIVHPDEVTGAGPFTARGRPWQLVYRHLFASRLDQAASPLVESALEHWNRGASLMVNPPAAHLEMKATFALLSELAAAGEGPFDEAERAAIAEAVPWTRHLRPGGSRMPDGSPTNDLVGAVAAEPARYVLKRSWSYGGVGVFVGAEAGTPPFDERLEKAFADSIRDWPSLVAHAARDGGYVVQAAVPTESRAMALHTPDGDVEGTMRVDYAAYASLRLEGIAWGGVVRAAPSAIVNIVGGGGVVPLLTSEVAAALDLA